jgi:hypothetical protein
MEIFGKAPKKYVTPKRIAEHAFDSSENLQYHQAERSLKRRVVYPRSSSSESQIPGRVHLRSSPNINLQNSHRSGALSQPNLQYTQSLPIEQSLGLPIDSRTKPPTESFSTIIYPRDQKGRHWGPFDSEALNNHPHIKEQKADPPLR